MRSMYCRCHLETQILITNIVCAGTFLDSNESVANTDQQLRLAVAEFLKIDDTDS